MAAYVGLGSRAVTGVADTTGNNPGNWTVTFDPAELNISTQIEYFEVYKITVQGAPGSTFTVYVDNNQWDNSAQGFLNSWDPSQPLQLQQGQTVYFYYSDPVSDGNPPFVTMWLRYDKSLSLYGANNG